MFFSLNITAIWFAAYYLLRIQNRMLNQNSYDRLLKTFVFVVKGYRSFIVCHMFSYLTECCQYCLSRMRLIILFLSFHSMMHAHWKEILNMSAKFLGIIHSINLIRNFIFVSSFWPMQYLCVLVILL